MGVRFLARHFLVLIAAGVLLAACTPDETSPAPVGPTASATLRAPSTPTVPSPSSDPTTGWQPVPDQPALRGVELTAIARAEQRFVAVGTADGHVLFLESPDGLGWHRATDLGTAANVVALAAGPRGLVAIGTSSDRPASWASDDGLAWTAGTGPFPMPALGTDTATVTDVVATVDGWIAVGREDPDCQVNCRLDPVRALVWTSPDGQVWTPVTGQPGLDGGGMESIVESDSRFVAAGIDSRHAAAWTSSDGMTWSRIPDAQVLHPQPDTDPSAAVEMSSLAVGHGVVVGLGTMLGVGPGGAPVAAAWWSADGRSWARAIVADATPGYARSLAVVTDGFLATGRTVRGDDWFTTTWRSSNGRTWETVPAGSVPDGFDPTVVAASSTVEIAVGSKGATGPAWWRPIS